MRQRVREDIERTAPSPPCTRGGEHGFGSVLDDDKSGHRLLSLRAIARVGGRLAVDLAARFGRGVSQENLRLMRLFYVQYNDGISQTVAGKFARRMISQTPSGKSELANLATELADGPAATKGLGFVEGARLGGASSEEETVVRPGKWKPGRHEAHSSPCTGCLNRYTTPPRSNRSIKTPSQRAEDAHHLQFANHTLRCLKGSWTSASSHRTSSSP